MARLFHVRPAEVEKWEPSEILTAGIETEGERPLESWLPLAMADLVTAWGGGKVPDCLRRWGFTVPESTQEMTDADWIAYAGLDHG